MLNFIQTENNNNLRLLALKWYIADQDLIELQTVFVCVCVCAYP